MNVNNLGVVKKILKSHLKVELNVNPFIDDALLEADSLNCENCYLELSSDNRWLIEYSMVSTFTWVSTCGNRGDNTSPSCNLCILQNDLEKYFMKLNILAGFTFDQNSRLYNRFLVTKLFDYGGKIAVKFHFYTSEAENVTKDNLRQRFTFALNRTSLTGTNFLNPQPESACDNDKCRIISVQQKNDKEEQRWQGKKLKEKHEK